jgi:hypothetical protein
MRQDTPEEIQSRMAGQYWGNPTSKLGKVGTAALKIASGVLGAPSPNFQKLAMEQWIAQNKIASEEESSEARLAGEQLKGAVQQQRTASQAQAATDRNRTMLGIATMRNHLGEAQLAAKQEMDASIMAGKDADTARSKYDLTMKKASDQALGLMAPLMGSGTKKMGAEEFILTASTMADNPALPPEQRAQMRESAQLMAQIHEANKRVTVGYTPATEDRRVPTTRQQVIADPNTGGKSMVAVPGERVLPGRAGKGSPENQDALSRILQQRMLGQPMPEGQPAPAAPLPQPIQPQPRLPQAPIAAPVPQPRAGAALPPGIPANAREINPGLRKPTRYRAIEVYPPGVTPIAPSLKADVQKADAASNEALDSSTQSFRAISDYYASGDLDKVSGRIRFLVGDQVGLRDLTSGYFQGFGDKKQKEVEGDLQRLFQAETAATQKRWSGLAVSEKEFKRLSKTTPQSDNLADRNLTLSYWNKMLPSVLAELERSGAFSKNVEMNQMIGDAAGALVREKMDEYANAMRDIKAKKVPKGARFVYNLDRYTDTGDLATETLRRAFPDKVGEGKYLDVQHEASPRFGNSTVKIQIPYAGTMPVSIEDERKKRIEEAKKRYREGKR